MDRFMRWIRTTAAVFATLAVVFAAGNGVLAADKLHLKDGRVLEGTVVRQEKGFVFFRFKVGGVSSEQLFTADQIAKIERDAAGSDTAADATKDKPANGEPAKPSETSDVSSSAAEVVRKPGVTRVAVLNFGPPSSWQGAVGSTVGTVVQAKAFREAVPMLEKDKVDLVVVRINSGGGAGSELEPFYRTFEDIYKKKFRTVGWIESAISAAAMSPWCISEFYFFPNGNIGACTGWFGDLQAVKGAQLELIIALMEEMSRSANRSPYIMRSMQIQEPLSVKVDDQGNVTWRQDEEGDRVINPKGQILTLTAPDGVKYGFAKGIASTLEELMSVMNVGEWELAGQKATKHIDDSMRKADKAEKRFREVYDKYALAVEFANGQQDRQRRGEFVGQARRALAELRKLYEDNPLNGEQVGMTKDWFKEQEQLLDDLMRP